MRKIILFILGLWLCGLATAARADTGTYQLNDGTSITGDVISFNDDGIIFRIGEDKYTDRVLWTKFSQDALKLLAKNPKLRDYAEPFIETPPPPRPDMDIRVHPVSRLDLPAKQSVIGALFSSFVGILILLLIYAANVYAGFEIAIFRAQPIGLVVGIAAILPIIGPIIFLSMPTKVEGAQEDMQMQPGAAAAAAPHPAVGQGHAAPAAGQSAPADTQDAPGSSETVQAAPAGWHAAASLPETQVFQRGQFTFNRRFFETKFSGFFGLTRHGANKDMLLIIKTPRAQYVAERVSRISANEAHFEVIVGAARQEVAVPFGEIQEVQLKHKDA
ncbi:MAG TPA: hypothetical protein VMF08_14735 [Candidatus Sulfotelmatobacter sp.]|nr:hypothetical protein [Candidatus Sulfotelmatobacter sp.]